MSLNLWWHSQHHTIFFIKKWWTVKQPICLADVTAWAFRKHPRVGVCGALWHFPIINNEKPPSEVWETTLCPLPLSTPEEEEKKHPVVHSLLGSFHPVGSSSVANDIGFSHRGIWEATRSQALFCHGEGMEGILFPSASPRMHYTEERGPCWHPSILIVPHP